MRMKTSSKVRLDRNQLISHLTYWYNRPGFPDALRICLSDTHLRRVGDICLIDEPGVEEDSDLGCTMAEIGQLVLNLPSRQEYAAHFAREYGSSALTAIPVATRRDFWANYPLWMAERVDDIRVIWE